MSNIEDNNPQIFFDTWDIIYDQCRPTRSIIHLYPLDTRKQEPDSYKKTITSFGVKMRVSMRVTAATDYFYDFTVYIHDFIINSHVYILFR